MNDRAGHWQAFLAAAWVGILGTVALMAAPTAFATLTLAAAGGYVRRIFAEEASVSLVLALLLLLLQRARVSGAPDRPATVFGAETLLMLGTVFCTVAGYFALEPLMEAARLGQGRWSFGLLHVVSTGFFAVKGLLVLVLAWRLNAPKGRISATAAPPS